MFLVLYVDDILLIGNDVGVMSSIKVWLSSQFDMKDLGEAEYVVACEVAKEAVWLMKFLSDLGVVRIEQVPITLFCDNSGAVAQSKDPRNHKKGKHIERNYHIIRDIIAHGDVVVAKIKSANNLADPFTKALLQRTFELHLEGMRVRLVHNSL